MGIDNSGINGGYPAPSGVSVANNIQQALEYQATHSSVETIDWFLTMEQGGGEWDYRGQGEAAGLSATYYQDIGNYNFGAVGAALGLSEYALENMGGLYQIYRNREGDGVPVISPPYGDDQADYDAIQNGYNAGVNHAVPLYQVELNRLVSLLFNFFFYLQQSINSFFNSASTAAPRRDPLVLDLNGNGLETTGVSTTNPILFDHTGTGIRTATGWVSASDGFLVLDRNGNGLIDSGKELFGDATVKSNGQQAADGFDALRDLDGNADGKISVSDAQYANLRIWRDLNQDGVSQSGELFTLSSLNIAAVNAASSANSQLLSNGNQVADLGSFIYADGSSGTVGEVSGNLGDINLAQNTFLSQFTDRLNTSSVANLPDIQGAGQVRSLLEAATLSPVLTQLLNNYSAAGSYAAQQALLAPIIQAWSRVGWVERKRNPSRQPWFNQTKRQKRHFSNYPCYHRKSDLFDGFRLRSTHPTPNQAGALNARNLKTLAGHKA